MKKIVDNPAPQDWLAKTVIFTRIKAMPVYVTRRLDELSSLYPKLFGVYERHGVDRTFYAPELIEMIEAEVNQLLLKKQIKEDNKRSALNSKKLKMVSYVSYASGRLRDREDSY